MFGYLKFQKHKLSSITSDKSNKTMNIFVIIAVVAASVLVLYCLYSCA